MPADWSGDRQPVQLGVYFARELYIWLARPSRVGLAQRQTIEQGALLATSGGSTAVRIGKWRPFEMSGDVDKPDAQLPPCGLTLQRVLGLGATSGTKTAAGLPR